MHAQNDLPRAALEIKALKELIHPNISRLYQVGAKTGHVQSMESDDVCTAQAVETPEQFYLVMEHAPGGELFDYIVAKDRLKVCWCVSPSVCLFEYRLVFVTN